MKGRVIPLPFFIYGVLIMNRVSKSVESSRVMGRMSGFSMAELVTVIVIVGILSATVAPRFFERNTFDARGFYDQTISTLRFAQKTAIAQRRMVCVTFLGGNRIVLNTAANFADVACNTDLQNPSGTYPAGQTTYTVDAPNGVMLVGAADFNFSALGRTNIVLAPITVDAFIITIDQETGYVR